MRASRSCPRSSVPKGCDQVGPLRRAVKSMSLMATGHRLGPSTIAAIIKARMTALAKARRWRRNLRHASKPGETGRARRRPPGATSTEGDAGVEPSIQDIGDQIEEDDKAGKDKSHGHDHRGVIGQDRADQQRADARHAEDLLGDNGTAEDG